MAKPEVGGLQSFKAEFFKALAHPVRIHILEVQAVAIATALWTF